MPVLLLLFVIRFGLSRTLVSRVSLSSFNRHRLSRCTRVVSVPDQCLWTRTRQSTGWLVSIGYHPTSGFISFAPLVLFYFAFRFERWTLYLGDFLRLYDRCRPSRIDRFNVVQWRVARYVSKATEIRSTPNTGLADKSQQDYSVILLAFVSKYVRHESRSSKNVAIKLYTIRSIKMHFD